MPVIYAQRATPSRARSCSRGGAPAYGGAHVGLSVRACRKSLRCYGNPSETIANSEQISGDPREPAGNARRPRRARGAARRVLHCVSARVAVFAWRIQMYSIARSIFLKLNIGLYRAPVVYAHHANPSRARAAAAARAAARLRGGICAGGSLFSREDSRRVAAGRLGPSAVADRISGGPRARGRRGSTAARARVCAAGSPW